MYPGLVANGTGPRIARRVRGTSYRPLVVDEVQFPEPAADQVFVKLFASGICHSQLHQIHRKVEAEWMKLSPGLSPSREVTNKQFKSGVQLYQVSVMQSVVPPDVLSLKLA